MKKPSKMMDPELGRMVPPKNGGARRGPRTKDHDETQPLQIAAE